MSENLKRNTQIKKVSKMLQLHFGRYEHEGLNFGDDGGRRNKTQIQFFYGQLLSEKNLSSAVK